MLSNVGHSYDQNHSNHSKRLVNVSNVFINDSKKKSGVVIRLGVDVQNVYNEADCTLQILSHLDTNCSLLLLIQQKK